MEGLRGPALSTGRKSVDCRHTPSILDLFSVLVHRGQGLLRSALACPSVRRLRLSPLPSFLSMAILLQLAHASTTCIPVNAARASSPCCFILPRPFLSRIALRLPSLSPPASSHAHIRTNRRFSMVNEERLGLRNVDPEFAFFDQAQMYVRAGSGGAGAATFKLLNGRQKGMADGGSGGKGGDVVFICDRKINTLQAFRGRASFHAENGKDGDRQLKNGADGQGVEVKVPPLSLHSPSLP
ncbi:gtp-binding protein obg, partial [Nannochloropsis gaditana]